MVREYHLAKTRRMGGALVTAPLDRNATAGWARQIIDEYQPAAVIAVERLGPNDQGIVHGSTGVKKDCVDLGHVFLAAQEAGILTVGVGDNGNEIGFGRIYDFMRDFHPYGRECQYEGGTGVITTIATDVFLPASISNWGAYGIAAMISFLIKDREVLQTPDMERRILEACLNNGGWGCATAPIDSSSTARAGKARCRSSSFCTTCSASILRPPIAACHMEE